MGTIQHSAVIVTSWDDKKLARAHKKAKKLFKKQDVTKLYGQGVNGYKSFAIVPCGSKLGWGPAEELDSAIENFVDYLNSLAYDDGSSAIKFVKLSYGELGTTVEDNTGRSAHIEEDEE